MRPAHLVFALAFALAALPPVGCYHEERGQKVVCLTTPRASSCLDAGVVADSVLFKSAVSQGCSPFGRLISVDEGPSETGDCQPLDCSSAQPCPADSRACCYVVTLAVPEPEIGQSTLD